MHYDTLNGTRRLERANLPRDKAEAIASEVGTASKLAVTHEQLKAALNAQTIRIVSILGGGLALGFTAVTIAISLS